MSSINADKFTITVGDTKVALKISGQSRVKTAVILGREWTLEGERIWLDRRIHDVDGVDFGDGWEASGAVVTMLSRARADEPGATLHHAQRVQDSAHNQSGHLP